MLLEGKTALITGGGKGIGKSIALAFAKEGADVSVAARTEAELNAVTKEIESMGRNSIAVVTDLSDPDQIANMVDKTMEKFGQIDILVNNSGIEGPIVKVKDMDLDAWNHTLAVNLTGAMLSAKHVLNKSMVPRQSGTIVNVSSLMGRKGAATRSPYNATKFAMIGFNQSLAFELGGSGIRVNCIAPGAVEGDRIDRVLNAMGKGLGVSYDEVVGMLNSRVALGRMVTPEEVASLALFLASDMSTGITGQTINCCGGNEMN
jgi:NAD(P)-dependent dehydrogenase (short-subunit alcohol dehydrogenase family)